MRPWSAAKSRGASSRSSRVQAARFPTSHNLPRLFGCVSNPVTFWLRFPVLLQSPPFERGWIELARHHLAVDSARRKLQPFPDGKESFEMSAHSSWPAESFHRSLVSR